MNEIRLTDGSLLEVKVNFLTIKLMILKDLEGLIKKQSKEPNNQHLAIEIASLMVYVILKSNGMNVDEDEACMLIPFDDKVISEIFQQFKKQTEKFQKKTTPIIHGKQNNKMK